MGKKDLYLWDTIVTETKFQQKYSTSPVRKKPQSSLEPV